MVSIAFRLANMSYQLRMRVRTGLFILGEQQVKK